MSAVLKAARAAVARRRLQTLIIGAVVLLSAATGVLALGLLVVSHSPFDAAFARAHGAHAAAAFAPQTSVTDLATTGARPGVTAVAGPFPTVSAGIGGDHWARPGQVNVVGRAAQDGPVDRLSLDAGSWLTGPGQIVVSRELGLPVDHIVGTDVTLHLPGSPRLRVVGVATSVTGTADAWVWPEQSNVLRAGGAQPAYQMLYRFTAHDSAAHVRSSLATATAQLPGTALAGSTSWLAVRQQVNRSISAYVPFVVAFAVLGLVLAVLISTNVVSGAVVAGFRTIGVLKTLGYTPRQVVGVYVAQVLAPALVGAVAGVALGVGLAIPLMADTRRAYDLPASVAGVPIWAIVAVLFGAPALVALAAVGPALRAGRLPATVAIAVGRAPREGRGFRLRRALTASRLPRPVALGLALPVARPARAVGTVVAILLGAVTLVFAVGLTASLSRVHTAFSRVEAVPVAVEMAGGGPEPGKGPAITPSDPATVLPKVTAAAGTAHAVVQGEARLHATGIGPELVVLGYTGDAGWVGYRLVSGRWYAAADEVVASSYTLRQTGHRVGDRLTMTGQGGQRSVRIVGELLNNSDDLTVVGDHALLALAGSATGPTRIEVGLTPGTAVGGYVTALQAQFPFDTGVYVDDRTRDSGEATFAVLSALIGTLTLLLCAVAALGVLNTVVLTVRERAHEIGVLKSLGMTPRQTRTMVVTSTVGLGLVAGAVAVPLGLALHHRILPVMGDAAGIGLPYWVIDVYRPGELVLLGLAGVLLAVLGALLPASWAARGRIAGALRAE